MQVYPAAGVCDTYTTTLQHFLHKMFMGEILLLLHPRTSIRIVVHIINEGGSVSLHSAGVLTFGQELSCCCNAVSLALVDAGIPLKSMLASVDIALMSDGTLVADPSSEVSNRRGEGIGKFIILLIISFPCRYYWNG